MNDWMKKIDVILFYVQSVPFFPLKPKVFNKLQIWEFAPCGAIPQDGILWVYRQVNNRFLTNQSTRCVELMS